MTTACKNNKVPEGKNKRCVKPCNATQKRNPSSGRCSRSPINKTNKKRPVIQPNELQGQIQKMVNDHKMKINVNLQEIHMPFARGMETILYKIIKNKYVKNRIYSHIMQYPLPTDSSLVTFSKWIPKVPPVRIDRTYISSKIVAFLKQYFFNSVFFLRIADIGGGNGDFLREIGTDLSLSSQNLYCVESAIPWAEPYSFPYSKDLHYILWDNHTIPFIEPLSLDVVLIMVTLHHMNDATIEATFNNLTRLMKPGGILIIKEHDCISPEDKLIIDWEHHLYHLAESPLQTVHAIREYKEHYIDNFKTMQTWDETIQQNGFTPIVLLNRLFEQKPEPYGKNPSRLYWKIYRKV
jgi:SAM-dependent methyltransferase